MLTAFTVVLAETGAEGEPLIHPYVVGGIAFGILMFLLLALIAFGAGREHS